MKRESSVRKKLEKVNEMAEIHPDYGPAASHSEHKVGDRITYIQQGVMCTGEILWVAAASENEGRPYLPMHYIVAPDSPNGFVHIVGPGDVITSRQET